MNSVLFYKAMSGFYDLLDVVYFRKKPENTVNIVFFRLKNATQAHLFGVKTQTLVDY